MAILLNVVLVIFVLVSLLMILVILMQRPKSEGLGAAFGGGVTDNIFGAQTTNVLTKVTGWLAGTFFFLTFLLSVLYAHRSGTTSGLRQELMKTSPTTAIPAASPGASVAAAAPESGPAVGAPNTVTNPTPGGEGPAITEGNPPTPADLAVGVTGPQPAVKPVPSAAPAASAQPTP